MINMALVKKLSVEELKMVEGYIDAYATRESSRSVDGEYILRIWDEAKSEYLYKMLGEQFIISRDVEFKKGCEEMSNELDDMIFGYHEDKDHIGSIFFNDSDYLQKQTTKIINYFIDGRFLCQNKLEDLFKEFCRHHFLPNETARILIPFTNKASYETISKVFDDKENSNRFLQPTCEHIEDFLKDEGVEVLYLPRTPEISTSQIKKDLYDAND